VTPINTTDPVQNSGSGLPATLETIREQIAGLQTTLSNLQGEQARQQSSPTKPGSLITLICAVIAAVASIAAAIISFYSGSMTAKTNAELTRFTTLQTEFAKVDKDDYLKAKNQIAVVEQDFQTFLFITKDISQSDPFQSAHDLDTMVTANRFGSHTDTVRDFYDFVVRTIAALQKNPDQWKDIKAISIEAQQRCRKATDALDQWLWDRK
jgi:hypothetical protein